ncbi:signal peptidase I [Candidatus Nanohalobium constans]|uniref:Signal peptidase I n=1 Tax=Candidatus Nanohalobium constans TaxID=2565781 RepID=A0A5Q0UFQ6_9ARCH|nr:signal peptidase I [Candidatus Nanohalobium constans]QGA80211.1 signal peptidase I [Candidatus Nanohalobium constans]
MPDSIILKLGLLILITPFMLYGISQLTPGINGFIVQSGSMEPEIMTGSVLFTKATNPDKIQEGDTITYKDGDIHTTHKVINKETSENQTTFKTKGIANKAADPGRINAEQVVGKKIFSIPYLGYIITLTGTKFAKIALIVVPATLLAGIELKELIQEIKE